MGKSLLIIIDAVVIPIAFSVASTRSIGRETEDSFRHDFGLVLKEKVSEKDP